MAGLFAGGLPLFGNKMISITSNLVVEFWQSNEQVRLSPNDLIKPVIMTPVCR